MCIADRRVVVTGLGVLSPLGIGLEANWEALCAGRSGIGPITRFDASAMTSRVAGEVKGFDPERFMAPKLTKRTDIFVQYALAAAKMAVADSGIDIAAEGDRVGVVLGCGLGGLSTIERYHREYTDGGPRKITPFFIPMLISNMASGHISIEFGARGPNISVSTACAAGTHGIGEACGMIREARADAMICGGVESVITPLAVGGFCSMKALSTRCNDDPSRASRPFERDRDGFVIAEGSGILIIEELEHARRRGARVYAELIGYGLNGDAHHMTAPAPEGAGAAGCMRAALKDAGIAPDEVDYINAHGTSTELNDLYETQAIKAVFGEHARKLAISSTKSMTGHLLGGAGGVEGVFTSLVLSRGVIPPTINYDNPDPACDLDYVPNEARERKVTVAMSNSFGFGGTNGSLIFRRFEG
ncbi:MAG: beta-ketoacyl-ACP synthase II [Pseudomonadota bacterium]